MDDHGELSREVIASRRNAPLFDDRIMFRVKSLYGLSRESVRLPLNEHEAIDSGQVCTTIDPDADDAANLGVVDFSAGSLKVRYGIHMVFPGLFDLVNEQRFDPSLLDPVRATATDECSVSEDNRGWQALGCLEFLPGSPWAGAGGG